MSTKIYDGFIVKNKTLEQLHKEINKFRQELKPFVANKYALLNAFLSVNQYDRVTMGEIEVPKYSYVSESYYEMVKEKKLCKEKNWACSYDFTFNMTLHPIGQKLLGITFARHGEMEKMWLDKPFIEEYCYFDNSDKPDEISSTEWRQRRKDWDKALPGYCCVPVMCGYTVELVEEYIPFINLNDIMTHVRKLNFKGRVHTRVEEKMKKPFFKPYFDLKDKSINDVYYNCDKKWLEYKRTSEYKKDYAEEYRLIAAKLKRKISKKDLLNKV